MSILSVGSVAFDEIETPFGNSGRIVGGSGSYISLSASYFGEEIKLCAVVGEDFPEETIALFQSLGIDTTGLQIKSGEKSFFWKGRYHNDMNHRDTLITELNVLEHFDPKIPSSYQGVEYVMLGNLAPQVQRLVLERLETRPKLVVMDTMNFWMDIALEELHKTLKLIDVLIINDEEARQLSGEPSLKKAGHKILDMGPKYLVIKKGEHGALLFHEDRVFFAPALPLEEVFDPTGAGDTFAGGFIGYMARTKTISFDNMKGAVIYGSAMASFCVEKFGTQRLESLDRTEMEQRVDQFIELTNFQLEMVF